MRRMIGLLMVLSMIFAAIVMSGVTQEKVQSRAYVGHQNDRDIQGFIRGANS